MSFVGFVGAIWRKNEMGNGVFLLGHHTVSSGKDYYRMGHAYIAKGYSPASPRALIVVGVRIFFKKAASLISWYVYFSKKLSV